MVGKEIRRVLNFIFSIEFLRMSVFWGLSLVISHLRLLNWCLCARNSSSYSRQPVASNSTAKRPICIITGATSGLGAAAAHALAKEGFFVVLVGRSGHLLTKTMSEIKKLNEDAQLEAFEVDLSSFSSIMKFKDSIQQWLLDMNLHSSIQLLINNAGILATSYRETADGFDDKRLDQGSFSGAMLLRLFILAYRTCVGLSTLRMMMTNYMGAFCLTKVLLPLLMQSPLPSRIVNVSSFTHRNVNDMQVDKEFISGNSFANLKQYPFAWIYGYSKLCMVLFSYELQRQINIMDKASQLTVNVADPGAVKTNIMREVPLCLSLLAVLKLLGLLQYPENGIGSILDAALAPPGTSGMYFFGGKGRTLKSSPMSYDGKLAERLWRKSCDLFLELKLAYDKKTANLAYQLVRR